MIVADVASVGGTVDTALGAGVHWRWARHSPSGGKEIDKSETEKEPA
jgi:hypothetical protein